MLNFVICDDNKNILDKLSEMLEKIFIKNNFEAKIVFKSGDYNDILNFVDSNKVDVLFLDIKLQNNKTGLEIAETIRKKNKDAYLIFTTGHLEFAMMAYRYKTFDYIAKPLTLERLEETVIRLFEDVNGLPQKYLKIDSKNTLVNENEIEYIKKDQMKLVFHTSKKDYEIYSSFNKVTEILPKNFIRCHKSYIINTNNVINIDSVENRLYFSNSSFCDIGPKYKKEIMEVFKDDRILK